MKTSVLALGLACGALAQAPQVEPITRIELILNSRETSNGRAGR